MKYRRIRLAQIGNSQPVRFAVEELTKYLKQMDAALTVDVLQFSQLEESVQQVIWVGTDDKLAAELPKVDDPALDDGIAIQISHGQGYMTGTNERSVLLAAYRFLKELGCDWVRPGSGGERIPQKAVEDVQVSVREAASYRHRGVCIEGADTYENILDMIDYLSKVGMNEYFIQFLVPGEFFERWYGHDSNPYLEKEPLTRQDVAAMTVSLESEIKRRGLGYHKTGHGWTCEPFGLDGSSWGASSTEGVPEETKAYLAQIDGKRDLWKGVPLNTNLCYSNPKVRDIMTTAITQYCKENEQVDILHFWLADGRNNHCECEQCKKKRPSDWYVRMLNELDEKLTAAGLQTKIVFLIYVDLLWEPEEERLQNPDRFILMFAPITRRYGQNYSDFIEYHEELPPYQRNQLIVPKSLDQNLEHLRHWQRIFGGDSFDYDYHLMWAHISDPGYERCARNLYQDMKDLHKIGINGMVSCQIQRAFFPTALPFNMMAATLWDENGDYEATARAYYESSFGQDGLKMHKYLEKISDLMLIYNGPAFGDLDNEYGPFCTDYAAVRKVITDFQPVIAENLQRETGPCRKEWEALQFHSAYVSLFITCFEQREQHHDEACEQAVHELLDLVNRNEMAIQKVMDGDNLRTIFRRRFKMEL